MFTKYLLPVALAAGTLVLSGAGSEAMPMAKPNAAPLPVETVGWRCGPGWHVSRWGRCVPNGRVIIRPMHVRHWHPGFWFHGRWHPGFWR
ncbi:MULTISPECIES: hypothetical protein [unclassified Mesorhizobium]|uniref:GCG_CRPN prefix-to-repeats domain-containing protein n=1 Tax=unclassified Mesorhizobium TaxID=325217 RepID=UPI0011289302|nr:MULTISPECIES: hypothetical protein [unclassified Mesorhizobium]TPL05086.1 hypothetical protein FJ567_01855 [Mesorhizobium sp. B2-4-16]TPL74459.1 hypothetical protein FJ956_07340 [Mesorhizobium sp. B2-4-3]